MSESVESTKSPLDSGTFRGVKGLEWRVKESKQ